jgi:hypothetical protein
MAHFIVAHGGYLNLDHVVRIAQLIASERNDQWMAFMAQGEPETFTATTVQLESELGIKMNREPEDEP